MLTSVFLLCCEGRKAGPHFVPVEDWGPWAEGEGLRDETLERSLGHKHAAWTCGATLSWRQEEGWGEIFTHFFIFSFNLRCVAYFSFLWNTNVSADVSCRSCTASHTMRSESCSPPSQTFPTSTQKRVSIMEESNVYASWMRSSPTLTVWVFMFFFPFFKNKYLWLY